MGTKMWLSYMLLKVMVVTIQVLQRALEMLMNTDPALTAFFRPKVDDRQWYLLFEVTV